MPLTVHVVTAVDYGETCDGHARTLGVFMEPSDATYCVQSNIEQYQAKLGDGFKADYTKMEVSTDNGDPVCCWSIDEQDVNDGHKTLTEDGEELQ